MAKKNAIEVDISPDEPIIPTSPEIIEEATTPPVEQEENPCPPYRRGKT
jgi:hypothetical protein